MVGGATAEAVGERPLRRTLLAGRLRAAREATRRLAEEATCC